MTQEVDRFPVKELPNRYGINRSVIYTRMEKLGVKTIKESNKSFVSGESLKLLDALDEHLKAGGTTNDFIPQTTNPTNKTYKQDTITETPIKYNSGNQQDKQDRQDRQDRQTRQTEQLVIPNLLEQVVNSAIDAIESRRTGLNDLRDLQEIADNNWLMPSGRLAQIIGRSRSYLSGKKEINYCGFKLEKIGKQGNETLWQVIRQ